MKFLERFWFGCGHCHDGRGCPVAEHADPNTGEIGFRVPGVSLVGAAVLVFLVPLASAILGAFYAGRLAATEQVGLLGLWQVGGAVVGFLGGVAVAKCVFWVCGKFARPERGVE
jgi:hypothetical protein